MANNFMLTSGAFDSGAEIPRKYTCDGDDISPALSWTNVPDGARSLALIVDDPDAPKGTFVHWVLINLPPDRDVLPENLKVGEHFGGSERQPVEGANDFGGQGYGGPCPPPGDDAHHYWFRLYALDTVLDLSAGLRKHQATQAMNGHILAEADLMGMYRRQQGA
ncbi:MAG TPA: YbhB/YbcL family Raf kinase inhibitor-like protein [Rhodothermales bacterium]|nr:YbhB/YbcL family Raf kinase inhibitor-like protein [Rhodothermales bacterium]